MPNAVDNACPVLNASTKTMRNLWKNLLPRKRDEDLLRATALFDAEWYLSNHPDVAKANIDPVLHFLRYGAREFRSPSEKFNTRWYLSEYPDVAESKMNPLVHYLRFGAMEGRLPRSVTEEEADEIKANLRRDYEEKLSVQIGRAREYYDELRKLEEHLASTERSLNEMRRDNARLQALLDNAEAVRVALEQKLKD